MVTTDSCVLHCAISEMVTRPWLELRFVVGYAGRRRSALLHAAGKFCDSIRDFLWIVSRCAPEFKRLLVGQNHLQHRRAKIQLQLTGGVSSLDGGAHGVGITACVWLEYAAFRFRFSHGGHHIVAGDSVAAPQQRRFYVSEFQAARRCIAALSGAALPRLWNEIVPGGPPSPSF